jgi:hypothetical protein
MFSLLSDPIIRSGRNGNRVTDTTLPEGYAGHDTVSIDVL